MSETKRRLSAEDWLATGLEALATQGPQALKAEPLAREMGTTKGSFYWHFQDVPDFHEKVLGRWRDRALAVLDKPGAPEVISATIYRLARPEDTEGAVRVWARTNSTAANVLAEIDARRNAALRAELDTIGLTNPEFAGILQAAVIGMEALGNADTMSTLLAAILALQEA